MTSSASALKLKDYYEVLQVKPSASQGEIKEAYLKLSKIYHPDVSEPTNTKQFIDLTEAFSVLSKTDSRREYDAKRKLLLLGMLGEGFRMEYPKPSGELNSDVLATYHEEMRRRWYERLNEWSRAQGAYELERGIAMDPVSSTPPSLARSHVFTNETRLYITSASLIGLFCFAYVFYVIKI